MTRKPGRNPPEYEKPILFTNTMFGEEIVYFSKPGLPNWDVITPSMELLAIQVQILPGQKILWLGCGHGAAAAALARKHITSSFFLLDINIIAVQMSALTAHSNRLANIHISQEARLLPEHKESFDIAIIDIPKGRELARRWLVEACWALRPGGKLYLAGANKQGIQTVIKDAQAVFQEYTLLTYQKGHRVARFTRHHSLEELALTASQFESHRQNWLRAYNPEKGGWFSFEASTPAGMLRLHSLPSVFSFDHLDDGTHLLLEHLSLAGGEKVLDVGCGYGVIGLCACRMGAASADLIDVNLLAVACARQNLAYHHILNGRVMASDILSAVSGCTYDLILTNPPFHSGLEVNYQITQAILEQSRSALKPGGRMLLVANRFIPYERMMQPLFPSVQRLAEDSRYHLLLAEAR
ncbi:MAG: class I SAM-dependent methyltransferase [Anaerolineales bacterium]|nr:class I SAM-dependent methyltransferase [Anaerolineales bacterium]